jgi:predicted metalloprotease
MTGMELLSGWALPTANFMHGSVLHDDSRTALVVVVPAAQTEPVWVLRGVRFRVPKPFRRAVSGAQLCHGGQMSHRWLISVVALMCIQMAALQLPAAADDDSEYDRYLRMEHQAAETANTFWKEAFKQAGKPYNDLKTNAAGDGETIPSNCNGVSAGDPEQYPDRNVDWGFYCPRDDAMFLSSRHLYWKFYKEIGVWAPVMIIAHEAGHHVQHQIGLLDEEALPCCEITRTNLELHADCLAGLFTRVAEDFGVIDEGDARDGAETAYQLGDEFADHEHHGTPKERRDSFLTGYNSGGDIGPCNDRLEAS